MDVSFSFLLLYYVSLRSEFPVVMSVTIPHKNYVRFVFTSSCLKEGSCLIYVICVCLRVMVSNTYCVVLFLFCFSSSSVPYVPSFSEISIFDCPFDIL